MSEPFVGEIRMFAGNFAPRNWAFCDGQLLAISQNNALFSLLGTIYGGDGRTTFGLPDLRGRIPVHAIRKMLPDAGDDYFIQPDSIANTAFDVAHQDRSAWSFNVEVRPFGEVW